VICISQLHPQSSPKDFYLRYIKKEKVAKDTYSFFFDRSKSYFAFLPGQHIRMTLPLTSLDNRGSSRFFTIASSPLQKNIIMITTKKGQSEFKKRLFELKESERVQFFGPIGTFCLRNDGHPKYIFIAGGIGMTPFHSIIRYISEKKLPVSVTLFASFSLPEERMYANELLPITNKNQNIRLVYTVTKSVESEEKWEGETMRISEELIRKYSDDITKQMYYIAGSGTMVNETKRFLESMGISKEKINVEEFIGY